MLVDVHQHVWTAPFVAALAARRSVPWGSWAGDGRFVVRAGGEVPYGVDLDREAVGRRVALLDEDGVDRALLALSSPLGVEALPRAEAVTLIEAYLEGALGLGDRFGVWGPVALDGARAADVDALLARGCAGVSVPAGAMAGAGAASALAPVFARLAAAGAPLFVHPGPGLGAATPEAPAGEPPWWSALTTYVRQMQEAWLTFGAFVRPAHPRLRVVFAMLAGTAPLLGERLVVRGGPPVDLGDPLVHYDTSSFGERAIRAVAEVTGAAQLVYGSDRPVIGAGPGVHVREFGANAAWLDNGAGGPRR